MCILGSYLWICFFFFQAEDGIRDKLVTGVQTCALPISFLGWTYRFQGKIEDAIAECKRAIEIDPEFGNPYNDIGAYLIELGQPDNAIPWLERATEAQRYEPRHFPHYNLGRAYLAKEMYAPAEACFQKALRIEPRYVLARDNLATPRRQVDC